MGINYLMVS
jgi:hypothetical protein